MRLRSQSGCPEGSRRAAARLSVGVAVAAVSFLSGCLTDGQVRSIQSQVGAIRRQVDQVQAAQTKTLEALQSAAARTSQPVSTADVPRPAPGRPAPETPPSQTGPEANRLYRQGYALFHSGRYEEAERTLTKFLELSPDGEEAAAARLFLAESLSARGRDQEAVAMLRPVIEAGLPAALVARALYDRALSEMKLGRGEEARKDLRQVLETFPDSDVAPLAKARLGAP